MKTQLTIIAAAGMMMLAACTEKKANKEGNIIVSRQEVRQPQTPVRMQDYQQSTDVQWRGGNYHIEVLRMPADTLPMVKDETGQKYVDNRICLTITRGDGSEFLTKQFTKQSFSAWLDDSYLRKGILEAMIFEKIENGCLEFALSVANPSCEDEFIPLKMKIDDGGVVTIRRDNEMD